MSGHTPGPWSWWRDKGKEKWYEWSIKSPTGGIIARIRDIGFGNGEANARLIAAAPELLQAAELALVALRAEDPAVRNDFLFETLRKAVHRVGQI